MSDERKSTGGFRERLGRMLGRRGDRYRVPGVDDTDLIVVVRSDDDTAASSAVLDAAGFASDRLVVLRHLLEMPAASVAQATASAALEGYSVGAPLDDDPAPAAGLVALVLVRVQTVDARTISQERSRTASMASRNGGRGVGWALLDAPAAHVE